MIDWDKTLARFGYSQPNDFKGIKRPKVICACDGCGKERVITVRLKSRIYDNQMRWRCPSCVCLNRSTNISTQMKSCWVDSTYRNKQITQKSTNEYRELQSSKIKQLWCLDEYRTQLEVGIRAPEFIDKCQKKFHDQFSYDKASFVDWKHRITIKCEKCQASFRCKPLAHLNTGHCPVCDTSLGQREIAEFISEFENIEFNNRTMLSGLELDILVPSRRLAIEYHGLYWHSYNKQETTIEILRHQTKAVQCNHAGIKLLQFFDFEWCHKQSIIHSIIRNALGLSVKLNARELQLVQLTNTQTTLFLNNNHLQGYRPASVIIGLVNENELIMVASFSHYKDGYEIIRLATKLGTQVRGGASRLLHHFRIEHQCPIYTFADLRYSVGNVYQQLGFQKLKITRPGYFYYKHTFHILSRQQCQKHKLRKLLGDKFDVNLSESQNMFKNGFRRVWTAGNILYMLN